jgi:nondiscriminating glutamyl-tRNA synthetase
MNNEYIKVTDLQRLVDMCLPHLKQAGRFSEMPNAEEREWVVDLVSLYREKLRFAAEIVPLTELFFQESYTDEAEAAEVLAEASVPVVLEAFLGKTDAVTSDGFTVDGIKAMIKEVQQETGFKGKQLFMPIRAALTGQTHGPDLNQTIRLLGRQKVIARLRTRLGG